MVWNARTGEPYGNAIVWQDTRTDKIAAALDRDGRGEVIRHKAGLPPATYFSGGKLAWMLEHVDGVREAAESGEALFGTTDSWVLWNLTGGPDGGRHVTDVTNASRTMLMDLETLDWDDELLGFFGVPREMLPQIVPSIDAEAYGTTRADGPFGAEVQIGGVLGDQQAAMVGQVCLATGRGQEHLRHRQLPAAEHRPRAGPLRARAARPRSATSTARPRRSTPSRARSRSPARRSSGCATSWASSPTPARSRPWPHRSTTPAARTSCRPSPACSPRTGAPTRAG